MRSPAEVAELASWHADWSGLKAAVLGSGVTGFAVADTLVELGADVFVISERTDDTTATILDVLGVRQLVTSLGSVPPELSEFGPELVVVSPGFSPSHPVVAWAADAGLPVWGEVELAWRLRDKIGPPAQWIAITGTNGKTTTVQLTTSMLLADGYRAAACGNVGVPVLDAIRDPNGFDVLVVELSSFQLHYSHSLSPYASVCLNVADDHLDWHGSAQAYRNAKARVYDNTQVACVYNADDPVTVGFVEEADVIEGARAIGFSLGTPGPSDFGIVDGILCDRAFLDDRRNAALEITTLDELASIGLAGGHMVANVLAASALARSFGASIEGIRLALSGFQADHHRTERVAYQSGVLWVDDSKATNPHAARASLRSFNPVVWIVGGLFKGADPDELVSEVAGRLRAAIIIGADRAIISAAFRRHAPELPVFEVGEADTEDVMPTAVGLAVQLAVEGDTVLLAPAAASMDQFTDYADRGRRFQAAVHEILGEEGDDDEPPSSE
nr:UDP-N-acetylmuramoyl-L-alanine--D-glutamate ligase [Cryobacterium sp. BB736]